MHFLTALWERGQFYSSFRSRSVQMETHLLRSPGMTELDLQKMVPSKIPSKYIKSQIKTIFFAYKLHIFLSCQLQSQDLALSTVWDSTLGWGLRMPSLVSVRVSLGLGLVSTFLAWLIHVSTNHFKRCVQEYATVVFTAPRQSKYPKTVSPTLWPDPQSCISCDSIIEQPSLLVHHDF